jgi:Mor family transcriptional regulator
MTFRLRQLSKYDSAIKQTRDDKIRALHRHGMDYKELAERFRLSINSISRIVNRRSHGGQGRA